MSRRATLVDSSHVSGGRHGDLLTIVYELDDLALDDAPGAKTFRETRYAVFQSGRPGPLVSGVVGTEWVSP